MIPSRAVAGRCGACQTPFAPMPQPAAFLDRDGVINVDHGYTWRVEDFEFVPGALAAAARLAQLGYALVVVTNQSGIGRGLYSVADLEALNDWLRARFAAAGAPLAGIYWCPHHPTEAAGQYRRQCDCRKPAPGLLLAAAREIDVDLSRSILFGDKASDLQAALAAGVPARVLLGTNGESLPDWPQPPQLASARHASLAQAVAALTSERPGAAGPPQTPGACMTPPEFEGKIVARAELAACAARLPRPVVLTNGVFDLLHRGHVTYLARARALGASLVVAVNSDASVRRLGKGDDRPINGEADRAAVLAALESVTLVTIFDETVPLPVLELVRPEIYVKGGDYDMALIAEAQLARTWGARTVAIAFEHQRSTTALLDKVRALLR